MFDDELIEAATALLAAARVAGAMVVTAESCTGGSVAGALTAVAGSSDVVFGGFVTYANEAKLALGVPGETLATHGAVSEEVARALAAAAHTRALEAVPGRRMVAVSVTGVAGPGGGSAEKPVGLVHFAATDGARTVHREARFGEIGRDSIRRESVLTAFSLINEVLEG